MMVACVTINRKVNKKPESIPEETPETQISFSDNQKKIKINFGIFKAEIKAMKTYQIVSNL